VREIVAAHGGTVSIADSQRGACVIVELPSVGVRSGAHGAIAREPSTITT
jgi:hypothetical protein